MRKWILAVSLGFLALAPALRAFESTALFYTPFYTRLPGGALGVEAAYSRHHALRLCADYRPTFYGSLAAGQQVGGQLGHRSYWFGSRPLSGLFLEERAAAYHVDDFTGSLEPYQYSLLGGGLASGWQFALPWEKWRLGVEGELLMLFSDKAHLHDFNGPSDASATNGRLHLNAWVSVARLF